MGRSRHKKGEEVFLIEKVSGDSEASRVAGLCTCVVGRREVNEGLLLAKDANVVCRSRLGLLVGGETSDACLCHF